MFFEAHYYYYDVDMNKLLCFVKSLKVKNLSSAVRACSHLVLPELELAPL